jgi:hypothetical protein
MSRSYTSSSPLHLHRYGNEQTLLFRYRLSVPVQTAPNLIEMHNATLYTEKKDPNRLLVLWGVRGGDPADLRVTLHGHFSCGDSQELLACRW